MLITKKNKIEQRVDDLSIVIGGKAGQGIRTLEKMIAQIVKMQGYFVFTYSEYMSRIRGGSNSTQIRVSSKKCGAFVEKIDILLLLDQGGLEHLKSRISPQTIVIGDSAYLPVGKNRIGLSFAELKQEVGGEIYLNTLLGGIILGMFDLQAEVLDNYLREVFKNKDQKIIDSNLQAGRKGLELGSGITAELNWDKIKNIKKNNFSRKELLLDGHHSVALGAVAGGCNFIASYPMTPCTEVLEYLAQYSQDLDIIAEQSEDEISAVNMAMGAWYAGARALVATSGGGFDLMTEGVSLAGMIESPLVICLGQRPGPATGLPTRTQQGDLNLALYCGHGEFPRAVLTPGNAVELFELTKQAFYLADKYQVPVIMLTEQFLADSLQLVNLADLKIKKFKNQIIKTSTDYKRYQFTKNGISPRGIPSFGEGVVCLDSDEHDESGHITEDFVMRKKMMDKRLGKLKLMQQEAIEPELIGDKNYQTLIVGWGTTREPIIEALEKLNLKKTACLHFKQVYPLPLSTTKFLKKAKKLILVENNATAQFGSLIRQQTGFEFKNKILKYDGLPFSVEELVGGIKNLK